MVVTFIFNYAMATMWGVIRGVKFIVFSPLLRMKIPANLSLFLSYLISFATFDYISMSDLLSDWF
jgi:flagellar biosynthesis protein FliR